MHFCRKYFMTVLSGEISREQSLACGGRGIVWDSPRASCVYSDMSQCDSNTILCGEETKLKFQAKSHQLHFTAKRPLKEESSRSLWELGRRIRCVIGLLSLISHTGPWIRAGLKETKRKKKKKTLEIKVQWHETPAQCDRFLSSSQGASLSAGQSNKRDRRLKEENKTTGYNHQAAQLHSWQRTCFMSWKVFWCSPVSVWTWSW